MSNINPSDDQNNQDEHDPLAPVHGGLLSRLQQDSDKTEEVPAIFPDDPLPTVDPASELPEQVAAFSVEDLQALDLDTFETDAAESIAAQPEEALKQIQAKMTKVTADLSQGKINQQQFQAMFTHYTEQRALILKLIDRSPDSDAWRKAAKEGFTTVLRRQHQAHLEGLAIFDNFSGTMLHVMGMFELPDEILSSVMGSLGRDARSTDPHQPRSTLIDGGRWLTYVRGVFTTAIGIWTLEPSMNQLISQSSHHKSFEEANHAAFESGDYAASDLDFTQEDDLFGW